MSKHVKALNHLRQASDYPARVVKQLEIQVQRDGGYGVPFDGLGKGFVAEEIGSLLVLFSSNPYELANLVGAILEKDESGKVREHLTDLLN
ncbi:hypothetical protein [Streptomyces parvus]|uniref:hypothetical protein n=1 Tax=Streptomyces parvus TaxID=66428 RepID=UPI0035DD2804